MKYLRNVFVILLIFSLALTTAYCFYTIKGLRIDIARILSLYPTPKDVQINRAIARLLSEGRASELYAFYAQDSGSPADSAYYTIGALQEKWSVGKAMAFVWYSRTYASRGKQSPMEIEAVGATNVVSLEQPISLAQYVRAERQAGQKVNGDMNTQVGPAILALIALHEQEMNRKFVVRFGDAIDWN